MSELSEGNPSDDTGEAECFRVLAERLRQCANDNSCCAPPELRARIMVSLRRETLLRVALVRVEPADSDSAASL